MGRVPADALDLRVRIRPALNDERELTMYIGIGTVVLILAIIIVFMLLRGRRV